MSKIRSFPDISTPYEYILLDAYGVFYGGNAFGLLPGAKECMEKLVSAGKTVGILSNTTQLALKQMSSYEKFGLTQNKHFHFLLTSGELTRDFFVNDKLPFDTPNKKFYLFGDKHPKFASHEPIFSGTIYTETSDLNEADFIYISIPHIDGEDQTDPTFFLEKLKELPHKKLPMICPNPDEHAHEGNPPRPVIRQGTIAKLYKELGGTVIYIGKPTSQAYAKALELFQTYGCKSPKDVLMVGDTPETDIRGARLFGMDSALITETGIMAERIARQSEEILDSLTESDKPTYLIKRFSHDI